MHRTESEYRFPMPDPELQSYFEDAEEEGSVICAYHFETVPELKKLLRERMGEGLSDRAVTEAVKETFRRKPREAGPQKMETDEGRKIVDYIYQM